MTNSDTLIKRRACIIEELQVAIDVWRSQVHAGAVAEEDAWLEVELHCREIANDERYK